MQLRKKNEINFTNLNEGALNRSVERAVVFWKSKQNLENSYNIKHTKTENKKIQKCC